MTVLVLLVEWGFRNPFINESLSSFTLMCNIINQLQVINHFCKFITIVKKYFLYPHLIRLFLCKKNVSETKEKDFGYPLSSANQLQDINSFLYIYRPVKWYFLFPHVISLFMYKRNYSETKKLILVIPSAVISKFKIFNI